MGRFAIGSRALGFSSGFAVKVGNEDPGPQRIRACRPGDGIETACGIVVPLLPAVHGGMVGCRRLTSKK
jgi:hypothetical protein